MSRAHVKGQPHRTLAALKQDLTTILPAGMRHRLFLLLQCIVTLPTGYGLPLLSTLIGKRSFEDAANQVSETIRGTWINPSDTLSVLLLIGGDVVLKAIAQLTGRIAAPVAFSFGWVAYSFSTLMSVWGDGRLMPPPDYPAKVFNVKSGFARDNRSWVLGRLLRDHDIQPLDGKYGFCITVYRVVPDTNPGVPELDWCWWLGVVTIIIQLGVSAIPFAMFGDWSIFLVTVAGTVLALLTTTLPQWGSEKWACRRKTNKVFCLTGGNGQRRVMVILPVSDENALDLEDLAGAESPMVARGKPRGAFGLPVAFLMTQAASLLLSALWILMLITVTGIKGHAWYLLFVGGIGMLQNALAAGAFRRSGTSGVHLEEIEVFKAKKVMWALMDLEQEYSGAGKPLLEEFFPGELRADEKAWWDGNRSEFDKKRKEKETEEKAGKEKVRSQPSDHDIVVQEARNLYRKIMGVKPDNSRTESRTEGVPNTHSGFSEHDGNLGFRTGERRSMTRGGAYHRL